MTNNSTQDVKKTKSQLLTEITLLRQKVAELENSQTEPTNYDTTVIAGDHIVNNIKKNTPPPQILVVDDSPASLKLLTEILTNHGYHVRPTTSGTLALRSVAVGAPDIILLDVKMPEMDGYELCRCLKSDEKSRHIPVIFISALDEIPDKVKGFKAGGVDFISKPFEMEEVLARVETHLRLRSLQKQMEERNLQLHQEIIDHKRTEDELKKERETFFAVLKNYPHGVALIDKKGVHKYLNPAFSTITGYTIEDIPTGREWLQKAYPAPEYRKKVIDTWKADALKTGVGVDRHFSITCKDGTVKDIEFRTTFLENWSITVLNDITMRTRVEKESQDMLNFLQTLIETIPSPIFYKDTEGIYRGCNKAFEEFLGLKKDGIVGKSVYDVYPEDLADKYHEMDSALFRHPGKQVYEHQILYADGSRHDVIFNKATYLNAEGASAGLVAVMVDITDHKRMEEELKKERETFFTVIKNYPHGVALVDRSGVNQYVNPEFTKITGYTIEDIPTGKDWFQKAYPVPEYRQKVIDAWKTDRAKTGIGVDRDFIITCKDGTVRDIEFRITFLENWSITVLNDITIRKRAEEALRESEQRLFDIINFLPDATFVIDLNGKVIAWNRAIEEMTGVKAEFMLGKGNYEYAMPFYGIRRPILIDLVFISDKDIEKKYRFIKKEHGILLTEADVPLKGESRVLWGKASSLYDSRGNIVGAIESIRDITDWKQAEEALQKRERELEAKTCSLEEINTTLKVLLRQREHDKDELEENVLSNIKQLVMPYIGKLKKSTSEAREADYVNIVESNLKSIVSPFSNKLSSKYLNLTPMEIQIANLIKEGKTSKEIAEILNSSTGTVEFHRENIRHKLNLKNKKTNLRSYLLTLS
ncbi:MAG: PAS domain S-box protein [Syntrophaceae bacterium]